MEIRKADSKGRVALGTPEVRYAIERKDNGFILREIVDWGETLRMAVAGNRGAR